MLTARYMDHSGYLLETQGNYLLFDYYTHSDTQTLEDGVMDLSRLDPKKPLSIFVSHSHFDHYNKLVHHWAQERPGTLLFLGDDIPPTDDATTITPGKALTMDGMTIRALRSTDQGVAFLVTVDGYTIYHAGDLHWWHWQGEPQLFLEPMDAAFKAEMAKLVGVKIDLAMVPVDPRLEKTAFWGAQYFMTHVGAQKMLPIHMWGDFSLCHGLVAHPDTAPYAAAILPVDRRGQLVEVFP